MRPGNRSAPGKDCVWISRRDSFFFRMKEIMTMIVIAGRESSCFCTLKRQEAPQRKRHQRPAISFVPAFCFCCCWPPDPFRSAERKRCRMTVQHRILILGDPYLRDLEFIIPECRMDFPVVLLQEFPDRSSPYPDHHRRHSVFVKKNSLLSACPLFNQFP